MSEDSYVRGADVRVARAGKPLCYYEGQFSVALPT